MNIPFCIIIVYQLNIQYYQNTPDILRETVCGLGNKSCIGFLETAPYLAPKLNAVQTNSIKTPPLMAS